jgi:hypothetical protein
MSARNGHRPPPNRPTADTEEIAVLGPAPPLLPDGEYAGTALTVETGFLPGARRKPRVGETERRSEWRLFVHVRLEQAASPEGHAALEQYRQEHEALPVTRYICRFEKTRAGQPIRPHTSSKLYQLLCLVRSTRLLGEVRFDAVVGRRFRFTLRTSRTDRDGSPKPRELWQSLVDKILQVYSPQTPLPVTRYQEPRTNNQPTSTEGSRNQGLTNPTPTAGRASRRRDQAGKQPTAPVVVASAAAAGADAERGVLVPVDPWTP